ncbi:O-methyltransferase [Actinopolyspora biskrensis]|uniref:O-methyltransferase n=1 Tax=Actinopolyspora biskrensis TaxID=1470178 RepID=A0A852Z543_9ACTN|nr:class I SAM-dependent methyltransferase [Actinopolyspora biskrensis]NYH77363.1 O-methyltransferase [Actinopolyspora biskrensis]
MSGQVRVDHELAEYVRQCSLREDDVLRRLREETARLPEQDMQISPEQGQFLYLVARLLDPARVLEIGVFTGYSTLCTARALRAGARLVACDTSAEWTSVARRYWDESGVSDRIDLRMGEATETLDSLSSEFGVETFDLAFVDADKSDYPEYLERTLELLRPGGLVIFDNTLWGGRVVREDAEDEDTRSVRRFNGMIREDARVDISLLPFADGLTLARKRER